MSKVIKNTHTVHTPLRQAKVISLRNIYGSPESEKGMKPEENPQISFERDKILQDAQAEAEQLIASAEGEIKQAKEEVSNLKAKWEKEKEVLQQEAYQQAYLQGLDEGRENGFQEYKHQITKAKEVISNAKDDYYLHIEKAESVILELGMKTAERIIGRTIEQDPASFLDIIRRGIKEVRELREIQIHIHTTKYSLLRDNLEELEAMFPVLQKLLIYPDDELGEEECFIETGQGRVIVSVDSQLREIKNKLVEILEGETG